MPLYEYKCKKCGHRFERIQSFSAEDVKECPVCHGEVERLISAPAIRFKGSGFYETDYHAKSSPPSGSHGENSAPAEKSSSDGAKSTPEKPSAEKSAPAKTEAAASSPAKNS